ncbi:MAG: TIGR02301 family protein [Methyloceanibacter sp.]
MGQPGKRLLWLAVVAFCFATPAAVAYPPAAKAQFFNWFNSEPAPKPRVRPKPPGDDLPPIVPKESTAPPPPDDRPYDNKLMRLAEILGAVHYLRELCGANEGQLWRDQMKEILKNEGTTAVRRAKLVNSFNDGYRGYRRTYRSCTQSATLATTRFSTEGAQIAASLAQGSVFASKGTNEPKPDASKPDEKKGGAAPEAGKEGTSPEGTPTGSVDQSPTAPQQADANGAAQPDSGQAAANAKPPETGQKHGKHHKAAAPETAAAPAEAAPDSPDGGF